MSTLITIPQIKGDFYGGMPYSVDLQVGTFATPSTLNISVINESGIYSKPKLSYKDTVTIVVGSLTFVGYLIEYKSNRSVLQKEMVLSYEDCSCLLDRYYVGLHKRHGFNSGTITYSPTLNFKGLKEETKPVSKYLIIVGHELHPCDINKDGRIDFIDMEDQIDWCDPCPSCPPDKYQYRCSALNDLKVFDVGYSFKELCDKIGITCPSIPSVDNIIRTYTGTLRSVLQSWCSEFALSYYWNFGASDLANGLVLFDRSIPITLNTDIDECKATEVTYGESIKNNFATSTISYYEREGQTKSYTCTSSEIYTLQCLRLRDLLNPEYIDSDIDEKIRWNELAICLSYYSSSLRDCLWWFNYYGIQNADAAEKYVTSLLERNNPYKINELNAKTIAPLGNMRILEVISSKDYSRFKLCKEELGESVKVYDSRSTDIMQRDEADPSYYFFVAEYSDELANDLGERDKMLAERFLGNHWLRITEGPGCDGCGITNQRYNQIQIDDPEGGDVKWFDASNASAFAGFTKYGHQENSNIANLLQKNRVPDNLNDAMAMTVDLGGGVTKEYNATSSFIYKTRSASWYPSKADAPNYQSMLEYYKWISPVLVGKNEQGQDSKILGALNPAYVGATNIALFIVQEIQEKTLPITITKIDHFLEPDTLKEIRGKAEENEGCVSYNNVNQNSDPNKGPILGSYGLAGNETAWVTFDGFSFMAPVQATELNDTITSTASDPDGVFTSPGYRVRATSSQSIPVCIPKIQQSVIDISDGLADTPRHELNYINITDDDIRIFGNRSCLPDQATLLDIHKAKSSATTRSKIGPEKNCEYQLVGVAPDGLPTIGEGLDSVTVKLADNGVFTNFTLSDKIAAPFSNEVAMYQAIYSKVGTKQAVGDYLAGNAANSKIPVK